MSKPNTSNFCQTFYPPNQLYKPETSSTHSPSLMSIYQVISNRTTLKCLSPYYHFNSDYHDLFLDVYKRLSCSISNIIPSKSFSTLVIFLKHVYQVILMLKTCNDYPLHSRWGPNFLAWPKIYLMIQSQPLPLTPLNQLSIIQDLYIHAVLSASNSSPSPTFS